MPFVTDIEVGGRHSFFITEGGKAFSCGDNTQGQLGLDKSISQDRILNPTKLAFFDKKDKSVEQVACGKHHTLALTQDGSVWSFGANNQQQVSPQNGYSQLTPSKVELPQSATQVSCAGSGSAALVQDGMCFMWGNGIRVPTDVSSFLINVEGEKIDTKFKSVQMGGQFALLVN